MQTVKKTTSSAISNNAQLGKELIEKSQKWFNSLHPAVTIYLRNKYHWKVPFLRDKTVADAYLNEGVEFFD